MHGKLPFCCIPFPCSCIKSKVMEDEIRKLLNVRLDEKEEVGKHLLTLMCIFKLDRKNLIEEVKGYQPSPTDITRFLEGQPSLEELQKYALAFDLAKLLGLDHGEKVHEIVDELFTRCNSLIEQTQPPDLSQHQDLVDRRPTVRSEPVSRAEQEKSYTTAFPALPNGSKIHTEPISHIWVQRSPLSANPAVQPLKMELKNERSLSGTYRKSRFGGKENLGSEARKPVYRSNGRLKVASKKDFLSLSNHSPNGLEFSQYSAEATSAVKQCLGLDDTTCKKQMGNPAKPNHVPDDSTSEKRPDELRGFGTSAVWDGDAFLFPAERAVWKHNSYTENDWWQNSPHCWPKDPVSRTAVEGGVGEKEKAEPQRNGGGSYDQGPWMSRAHAPSWVSTAGPMLDQGLDHTSHKHDSSGMEDTGPAWLRSLYMDSHFCRQEELYLRHFGFPGDRRPMPPPEKRTDGAGCVEKDPFGLRSLAERLAESVDQAPPYVPPAPQSAFQPTGVRPAEFQVACSCEGACNCVLMHRDHRGTAFNHHHEWKGPAWPSASAMDWDSRSGPVQIPAQIPSLFSAFTPVSRHPPAFTALPRLQTGYSCRPALQPKFQACLAENASADQKERMKNSLVEVIKPESSPCRQDSTVTLRDFFGHWPEKSNVPPDFAIKISRSSQTSLDDGGTTLSPTPSARQRPRSPKCEEKTWKEMLPLSAEDLQKDYLYACMQAQRQGVQPPGFIDIAEVEGDSVQFPDHHLLGDPSSNLHILQHQAVYVKDLEKAWLNESHRYLGKSRGRRGPQHPNKPCSFYLEGCCYRFDCRYSHDLSTITCHFWEMGQCFKGDLCPFLHGYHRGYSGSDVGEDFDISREDFPELSRKEVRLNSAPAPKKRRNKKNSVHRLQLPRGT